MYSPDYRRQHIVEKMVFYMLTLMDSSKEVVVTTYCEGVLEGIAARAFYEHLGFVPWKLSEEFGSPVQEFISNAEFLFVNFVFYGKKKIFAGCETLVI